MSLKEYHVRKIDKFWPYVFIDGMAIKFYDGLELKERVVLIAMVMDREGNKEILGWVTVRTEHETAVRSLLLHLKEKGLKSSGKDTLTATFAFVIFFTSK